MRIMVINGNPKPGGFISGALDLISDYLESREVEVRKLRLAEAKIEDCQGCFDCLKTGNCILIDDMAGIINAMQEMDGFVVGSPVRNGLTTACYKRFYERITYLLGFPLLLEDKYTLALSCVGYMGGKSVNKRLVGLQDVFHTRLSDYLFFKVGIPTKIQPAEIRQELEHAAAALISDIHNRRHRPLLARLAFRADRIAIRKFMLKKNPAAYANVIAGWKEKGYI